MAERKFITFLSDFGHTDDFVGTCHGVIKTIAPDVEILDISHCVRRHDILQGAIILANTIPYMPESVILAVVDPGVGVSRKPVAMRTASGRYLVGPNNGLLSLATAQLGGPSEAVELACSAYSLQEVCKTFEGRDLFSPAAAHLSNGVPLSELGAPLPLEELEIIILPEVSSEDGGIRAKVIYIDHFGNVQLYLKKEELEAVGSRLGCNLELTHDVEKLKVPFVQSFADVEAEELLIYEDSYKKISFAINQGDAARSFQIGVGDEIVLRTLK